MFPFAILGKGSACMQIKFPWSKVEPINSMGHATACSIDGKKSAFLGRSWVGCPKDLRNF